MDIEKLDMLLEKLRQADRLNKSVDFNEFCESKWGKSMNTAGICEQLTHALITDGYAEFMLGDKRRIRLIGNGRNFKGYKQTEIEYKESLTKDYELKQLTTENLKLQNESLAYQIRIRDKESEIRQLTADNLHLQNRQLKRYVLYAIIGSVVGAIITWLIDN